jgi:hypothetical protein
MEGRVVRDRFERTVDGALVRRRSGDEERIAAPRRRVGAPILKGACVVVICVLCWIGEGSGEVEGEVEVEVVVGRRSYRPRCKMCRVFVCL